MSGPRVLIVRFSAIGDCVMTAIAVSAIRRHWPDAHIAWAIQRECIPALDADRLVNEFFVFDRKAWKKEPGLRAIRLQAEAYRRLRGHHFDYGFDFQGHSKTAWALYTARPKQRFAGRSTDWLSNVLTPPIPNQGPKWHEVDRAMTLVRQVIPDAAAEPPIMPDVNEAAQAFRREVGGERIATIQTGAGEPRKRYPHWEPVAQSLEAEGWTVVALGGPGDPLITGAIDRVGKGDLRQAMAAVAGSDLHLAGDTGTGHIAAAYGVPVVSIFGHNHIERFRPYGEQVRVLKVSDDPGDVPPDQVLQAARELAS